MKNFKKTICITIIFSILFTNFLYAESNIIYAPTKEPESYSLEPESDTPETIVTSEIVTYISSDVSNVNYEKIYRIREDNSGNLYVTENGDRVRNAWRKISIDSFSEFGSVENFNHDYIWAYFNSAGKALKGSSGKIRKVDIDNKYYAFNEYGQMLEGFFNERGEMWNGTEGDPFDLLSGEEYLYHADPNTGILTGGWYKYNEGTDKYEDKENIWLYFSPSTFRSVRSTGNSYKSQTIDGKVYAFDNRGVMLTGFEAMAYNYDNGGNTSKVVYFDENGREVKNGFVEVDVNNELNSEIYENMDEDITIYLNKSGTMYKNTIKKIGAHYYGFDEKGAVVKGLSVWRGSDFVSIIETVDTDGKKFMTNGEYRDKNGNTHVLASDEKIHYFDGAGERELSGKLEFEDDTYTYKATNNGANNGVVDKKFYKNGLLIKPMRDTKYGIYILDPIKSDYTFSEIAGQSFTFVLNSSGSKQTSNSALKDEEENYWLINNSGNLLNIYSKQVKYTSGKYYFKSEDEKGHSTWILFGEKDCYGKTCVLEVRNNGTKVSGGAVSSYQVKPSHETAINFYLK